VKECGQSRTPSRFTLALPGETACCSWDGRLSWPEMIFEDMLLLPGIEQYNAQHDHEQIAGQNELVPMGEDDFRALSGGDDRVYHKHDHWVYNPQGCCWTGNCPCACQYRGKAFFRLQAQSSKESWTTLIQLIRILMMPMWAECCLQLRWHWLPLAHLWVRWMGECEVLLLCVGT
jgi:hypothetical protein